MARASRVTSMDERSHYKEMLEEVVDKLGSSKITACCRRDIRSMFPSNHGVWERYLRELLND